MKSSAFDKVEGLLAHREELQADLQSIDEAEKRCAVVSGIHLSENRLLLEQNYNPMDRSHLERLSGEVRRLTHEYVVAELMKVEEALKGLGVVLDD